MSHEVETMFSGSNQRPWHGLGKILPGHLTTREALVAGGLDWDVSLVPVVANITGVGMIETGHRATVRSTDNRVLGVVGPGYAPLQNRDAFGVIDPIVADGTAVWESAGSLHGGRAVWALAKLPSDIVVRRPGGVTDEVKGYLLVTNRHDGYAAAQVKLTPIRVVCQNTLTAALRGGAFRVTHVGEMGDRIRLAAEALHLANAMTAELAETYQAMADRAMTEAQQLAYFRRCLRQTADPGEMAEAEAIEQARCLEAESLPRRLNRLLDLAETGRGSEMARGTLWGCYNAVVELADHGTNYRTPEAREAAILAGGYQNLKGRALKNAVTILK
jgi:phage/plasmid-like protein (TIGR03299 family)